MHSASETKLENIVREQLSSIVALVQDAIFRLFGHLRQTLESIRDKKVISVIRTVKNRALDKYFRIAASSAAVGEEIQKFVSELPSDDAVATKLVDTPSFAVPVTKLVKN